MRDAEKETPGNLQRGLGLSRQVETGGVLSKRLSPAMSIKTKAVITYTESAGLFQRASLASVMRAVNGSMVCKGSAVCFIVCLRS